jgi:hypothetical protein
MKLLLFAVAIAILLPTSSLHSQIALKNRVIILTDIENEPDDTESMIRLLLYSNLIDIKGLVATTSVHLKDKVFPESILRVVKVYGKVQPNLLKHEPGFPSATALSAIVRKGLPLYGMFGVGNGKDSPGSELIIQTLKENDRRPLWLSVWGGVNTLAQALYKLRASVSTAELDRLVSKLRVYTISDQDDSGHWIRKNFPKLFYIVTPAGYSKATWTGIHTFVKGINNETISNAWLRNNIQQNHGPLGALYPDVAYGMEGDTPSWLSLIPNGLNVPDQPNLGGWGGRYELYNPNLSDLDVNGFTGGVPNEEETRAIWTNAVDSFTVTLFNPYARATRKDSTWHKDNKVTLWRWRDEIQQDFAARMDWTFLPYEKANHPPIPALDHPEEVTVKSGSRFFLSAAGSKDPDGDNLSYLWFQYMEAGVSKKVVGINGADNIYRVSFTAPVVEKTETTQMILKVTDKGTPALTRYKRVKLRIEP